MKIVYIKKFGKGYVYTEGDFIKFRIKKLVYGGWSCQEWRLNDTINSYYQTGSFESIRDCIRLRDALVCIKRAARDAGYIVVGDREANLL